ncbi:metal dependent phosphohydrolase [Desulfovibrio sp. X2]|uniref:HD-GYP domain-containing protein n=1 Tax=Desulfovibrio sp. X2 TaxID=941449 RepID=UPI0003588D7F|nr:HD domain-containing phosphohydrolase [Desulfovibrio sp. X2]EPR40880.1 metal dependent phosphohydrolase [Desulfovibrio sp. X2]
MSHGPSPAQQPHDPDGVFPVSPLLIIPSAVGGFSIYLRLDGNLILYARKGERFTDRHRTRLHELGVRRLFVKSEERGGYENYLQEHLGSILDDESIPLSGRVQVWYEATLGLVRDVFEHKLPRPLGARRFEKVRCLVRTTLDLLSRQEAVREMARFLTRGFSVYSHGIGTMVLTACVLQGCEDVDDELLEACAMGALLHDIGKTRLPREVAQKNLEALSAAELELYRSHPALGVAMCSGVSLPPAALHCMLMHHERVNGSGYPGGAQASDIPRHVAVLSVCDMYDNYTRAGAYGPALSPFEALSRLQCARGLYDTDAIKRLILVLADARVVEAGGEPAGESAAEPSEKREGSAPGGR